MVVVRIQVVKLRLLWTTKSVVHYRKRETMQCTWGPFISLPFEFHVPDLELLSEVEN